MQGAVPGSLAVLDPDVSPVTLGKPDEAEEEVRVEPSEGSASGSFAAQEILVSPPDLEQGSSGPDADALVVQQHREDVLRDRFRCWYLCFGCTLCFLAPTWLGIFLWMLAELMVDFRHHCDVPLQAWALVVCGAIVFDVFIRRCVTKWLCRWSPDSDLPRRRPMRVRVLQHVVMFFSFVWNCVGLMMAVASGSLDKERPCSEEAPGLRNATLVYTSFKMAMTIIVWVNMIGLTYLLGVMMRAGVLRSTRAAPKGALEKNTVPVVAGSLKDNPTCSVCWEDFDDSVPIVRTRRCEHAYHKQCLKDWLQVNRNCPLCRQDLGDLSG